MNGEQRRREQADAELGPHELHAATHIGHLAPQGVPAIFGATQGARVVRRVGLRTFLTISGASAAVGPALAGLALGHHSYPLVLVGLLLAGYGTATGVFAATVAATQGVANAEQGLASGLINMSRQVGAAVGVAVSAAVIGSSAASRNSVTADRAALLVTAAAAVLAAVIALRGIGARSTRAATEAKSPERATSPPVIPPREGRGITAC